MNVRQQAKRKSWHSMSRQSSSSKKKDHQRKLEGERSKNRKLKDWWSLRYPWQCQVRVHHRLRSRPNRITLSRYFQSANMIENSDIEVTEDECVCSLVTFDDAIRRLSWKPFVTTTTSPWMVSLAHFPICWKVECQPQEHVCCELETGSAQWHWPHRAHAIMPTSGGDKRLLHARQLQTTFVLVASSLASTGQGSRTTMRRSATCCPRMAPLKENRWHLGLKNSTHTDLLVRQPCPIRGDATWLHVRARRVAPRVPDAARCRAWILNLPTSCTWRGWV